MAEQSMPWTTNGTGDGVSGGYSQQRWYDIFRKLFTPGQSESAGVVRGEGSELAVTGTASPLSVAAGAAVVRGFIYENTSSLNLTVSTPAATTGGRVVLEANWTAQTVRAKVVMSSSGVTTPPALTQTDGTTWQISLATFTITSGGAITLTDDRSFCHFGTKVDMDGISTPAAFFDYRLGGSSTDWNTGESEGHGSLQTVTSPVKIRAGTYTMSISSGVSKGTFSISCGDEYTNGKPIVFLSYQDSAGNSENSKLSFAITGYGVSAGETYVNVAWGLADAWTTSHTVTVNALFIGPA